LPTIGAERTRAVAERILAEYQTTQGLHLTRWQIQQLWRLDVTECDAVVKTLADARFLREGRARPNPSERVCWRSSMNWLFWLTLAVIIAAVTGVKPKGTRHVAHTRLMGVARLALLLIFAYLAFRARSGG
jgi:hypothetical protein